MLIVRYISWTEQTFPKGGKDGDLQTLLKNCVIHFKEETRYHDDPRYIKIWIKFVSKENFAVEFVNKQFFFSLIYDCVLINLTNLYF